MVQHITMKAVGEWEVSLNSWQMGSKERGQKGQGTKILSDMFPVTSLPPRSPRPPPPDSNDAVSQTFNIGPF